MSRLVMISTYLIPKIIDSNGDEYVEVSLSVCDVFRTATPRYNTMPARCTINLVSSVTLLLDETHFVSLPQNVVVLLEDSEQSEW